MNKQRLAALGLVTALTTAAVTPANAQSSSSSPLDSLSSSSSRGSSSNGSSSGSSLIDFIKSLGSSPITNFFVKISEGLTTKTIGDILGPGISDHVGFMSGDLGIMVPVGENEEFAIIFGDSFRGARFGQGDWLSPVGVIAAYDAHGKITIKRPLNSGDRVEQLLDYAHNERNLTFLPSDVINMDGTLYMQGMWNEGVGNVLYTQIWKSTDSGKTWQSVATTDKHHMNGFGDLITWERGTDGYIYVMSSRFQRADSVYLSRFRPEQIGDRDSWEHYINGTWKVPTSASELTPIISTNVRAGEMSLRRIDNHWVLAMFNARTASIDVRISKDIDTNWNEIKPAHVVVASAGGWASSQSPSNFTQLYGGYIAPGSRIDNLNIVVSQWNTSNNSRYMSTQFNVRGLDTFFGISAAGGEVVRHNDGDESVLEVETQPLSPDVAEQLTEEKAMEAATDIQVIPLDDHAPVKP